MAASQAITDGPAKESTSTIPKYVTDPEGWIDDVTTAHEYVCLIIFRGSWCSFDKYYLTQFGTMRKEMEADGVHLIAWTSEGEEGAKRADEAWKLTSKWGYDQVIGDSTCALGKFLKEDETLPKLIISSVEEAKVSSKIHPGTYKNGLVQPALVFYAHHGILVLHWEAKVRPSGYGASQRPVPSEVWRKVQKRKHALDMGNAVLPADGSKLKQCCNSLDAKCPTM